MKTRIRPPRPTFSDTSPFASPFIGRLLFLCVVLPFLGALGPVAWAEPDFAREVLPILSDRCFLCHGPDAKKDALRLDSTEAATLDLGGYKAIDPDSPEDSEALARIHDREDPMPPVDAEKQLSESEREILSAWIRAGGTYGKHWAFVKPEMPKDATKKEGEKGMGVDDFIAKKLKDVGLDFAEEADASTLARRAALTLTGLPPSPELLAKFSNGEMDYEGLVDALLADSRYGEHQARYWLDAVRYGDTHGLHLDNKRGIYPYRDWVVKALNENLPLDEFITWQLAGDLLPNPTLAQRVATGFVRMNPTTAEGGAIVAEFQAKNNFDRTETLGTIMMGMTLNCARCHTHKYDPITQTEYFELLAFFNNTSDHAMDGNKYDHPPTVRAPRDQAGWAAWEALEKKQAEVLATLKITSLKDRKEPEAVELRKEIEAAQKTFVTTLIATDLPANKRRVTKVLERGEYNMPTGEALEPGGLSVLGEWPEDLPRNRLGLAKWLMSDDHPLVARVWVNRIWQRVFGDGIVRSPEDFGLQGQYPTHPALLDWLAITLRESGWDQKAMLKRLVMSRTFRQSSAWREGVDDPENKLFARGPAYRLDAEVLRDTGLWASGLLDPHMGGEGVKPYQPAGMWRALAHPSSNTKTYQQSKAELLYRRSLYVYWKRTSPHPMMTLFDAPDRESSCVRRGRTNTALQSLALFNETQRVEIGRKLGERLLKEQKEDKARLNHLFELLACREASPEEAKACLSLLAALRERFEASPNDAKALLATGEAPLDASLPAKELAAWSQVAITVLASDLGILMY